MGTFGVVESVKAVSDLYSPISGTVVEVNPALEDRPELVNQSPYDEGWMIVIDASNPDDVHQLMSAADYQAYIQQEQSS
jgi:glycine cleavage system H protein